MKKEKNNFFHSRNELKRNLKESERHWPSQSKMKVSTESMSSSAFFKGWAAADALVVKFSILVLHFLFKFKFLFHVVQFVKLCESPFRPKNLGIVGFTLHKIRDGDVEEEEETADTETTVLLSISVSVLCSLFFSFFFQGKKLLNRSSFSFLKGWLVCGRYGFGGLCGSVCAFGPWRLGWPEDLGGRTLFIIQFVVKCLSLLSFLGYRESFI